MQNSLIRYLEDNSMALVSEAMLEVRGSSGPTLQGVSDADLQVALYTVLLKVMDTLRDRDGEPQQDVRDVRAVFLRSSRELMGFIDGQSAYTTGHTANVARHVVYIASRLGLSDPEIEDLEYATWIHNIGLINQSQKLSTLPRALTPDELKQVRNHVVVGADIVRPIDFLAHLIPVILYHHHRFDGSTNPGDPVGKDLPMGSRLIALADAYQAMVEERPYRPAFTRQEALEELVKGSGSQFDPQLVPLAAELT